MREDPPRGRAGEKYECGNCHRVLTRSYDDAEALAEMEATLRDPPPPGEQVIVCDDCYQAIMARVRAEAPELLR